MIGVVPERCEGSVVTKVLCNSLKAADKVIKLVNNKGGGAKRMEGRVRVSAPLDAKAASRFGEGGGHGTMCDAIVAANASF